MKRMGTFFCVLALVLLFVLPAAAAEETGAEQTLSPTVSGAEVSLAAEEAPAKAFAETDNRNIFASLDHSTDDVLRQALETGVTDLLDDKYGLFMDTYYNRYIYLLYSDTDLIGLWGVTRYYLLRNNQTTAYTASYSPDAAEMREAYAQRKPQVMAEVREMLSDDMDDFEIVHIVHDYLAVTNAYDVGELKSGSPFHKYAYDASGAFVKHSAVCQGIALSFKAIMEELDIPCMLAVSSKACHAWNLVYIEGEWYHVDVTTDDPFNDLLGRVGHKDLFISTETLLQRYSERSDFVVAPDDYTMVFTDAACARDKSHESGEIWRSCNTCCHWYDGDLYTADGLTMYKNGEEYLTPATAHRWTPYDAESGNFNESMIRLCGDGYMAYVTTTHEVYQVDLRTGENRICCAPTLEYQMVLGLGKVEGKLYYTIGGAQPSEDETWIPFSPLLGDPLGDLTALYWQMTQTGTAVFYGEIPQNVRVLAAQYDAGGKMLDIRMLTDTDTAVERKNGAVTLKLLVLGIAGQPAQAATVRNYS